MVGLVQLLVVIITYKFTNRYDQMGVKVIWFFYIDWCKAKVSS